MPRSLDPKVLRRMSDAELREEVERRRKLRARGATQERKKPSPPGWLDEDEAAQVLQWYANLELAPGAQLDEIDAAYERLVRKFHPERHREPERKKAAEKLLLRLEAARDGLKAYARRRS
ncbi:MAG: DnaJ domain-containing protein [Sandaracinus sp.]|nr:DnaJ domain-containing protein [Sandaracinus sp.]MCB9610848.1 DnaJ domain-containing protein [Sandaracinus sp.]MCB9633935.1 DnaJ domain-containing protein [Sandaracinus sp.]